MLALFQKIWDLCLLSAGPQDLPFSTGLLKLLLLSYVLIQVVGWTLSVDIELAVFASALDAVILFVFVYIVLQAFQKSSRFTQTITSFLAVGSVFQLLELPLMYFIEQAHENDTPNAEVGLLLVALYSWSLAAFARIFQQSLEIKMLSAIVLTLCYVLITLMAIHLAFPNIG